MRSKTNIDEIMSSVRMGKSSRYEEIICSNVDAATPLPWLCRKRRSMNRWEELQGRTIFNFTCNRDYMIPGFRNAARPPSCLGSLFVRSNNQGFPTDTKVASKPCGGKMKDGIFRLLLRKLPRFLLKLFVISSATDTSNYENLDRELLEIYSLKSFQLTVTPDTHLLNAQQIHTSTRKS